MMADYNEEHSKLIQVRQLLERSNSASSDGYDYVDVNCSSHSQRSDADPPRARRRLNDGLSVSMKEDSDNDSALHPDVFGNDVLIDQMGSDELTGRSHDGSTTISSALLSASEHHSDLSGTSSRDELMDGVNENHQNVNISSTSRSRGNSEDIADTTSVSVGSSIEKKRNGTNKRSLEEEHTIILQRSCCSTSKSSNTKYRCKYCDFVFIGGPQKIRVHLTGRRENGTRLSRCLLCPPEVKSMMEARMKLPKEQANNDGLYEDDDKHAPSLQRRNYEENHCVVLSRSSSSQSKSSNSRYKCIYCRFKFVGGPQKIRVHLTGVMEGGTKVVKCTRAPPAVITEMNRRRKTPRVEESSKGSSSRANFTDANLPKADADSQNMERIQRLIEQGTNSGDMFNSNSYGQEIYESDHVYFPRRYFSSEPNLFDAQLAAEQIKASQLMRMSSAPAISSQMEDLPSQHSSHPLSSEEFSLHLPTMQYPYAAAYHALNPHRQYLYPSRTPLAMPQFYPAHLPNFHHQQLLNSDVSVEQGHSQLYNSRSNDLTSSKDERTNEQLERIINDDMVGDYPYWSDQEEEGVGDLRIIEEPELHQPATGSIPHQAYNLNAR